MRNTLGLTLIRVERQCKVKREKQAAWAEDKQRVSVAVGLKEISAWDRGLWGWIQ